MTSMSNVTSAPGNDKNGAIDRSGHLTRVVAGMAIGTSLGTILIAHI
jgi:hypothetical protein